MRTFQKWKNCKNTCCTASGRTQQLRVDDLSRHELRESQFTVNQFAVQIQESQDKVDSLNDARDFHDLETASSFGLSHVPIHPSNVPSSLGKRCRDFDPKPDARNSCGTPGNVFFENPSASEEPTASCSGNVHARSSTTARRTCVSQHKKIYSEN